jgi:pre-mRNA-splicing factor ISY1
MTTLARWRASQLDDQSGGQKERRPYLASECDDLKKAEKWRLDIVREISKKVTQIQNAGLGEFRIRDLNDQINKLLREKKHWEFRIAELGGPNYRRAGGPKFDNAGREVPGNRGYKYFGAAKDLPGVRDLFSQEPLSTSKKTRAELMKDIDADYYGYRDEDDGVIVPMELEAQKKALLKALESQKKEENADGKEQQVEFDIETHNFEETPDVTEDDDGVEFAGPRRFVSHVPSVPSQQQVQEELLRRKKLELMEKYVSESLQGQENEAKNLMGIN